MKKKGKLLQCVAALLIMTLMAGVVLFDTCAVYAEENEPYEFDMGPTIYMNEFAKGEGPIVYLCQGYSGVYTDKVKSDNTAVIKVVRNKNTGSDHPEYILLPKKPGKARITATFKDQDGNTQTISKTFRVKSYPDFIKSFRVNGKKINVKKNSDFIFRTTKKTTASIKFNLKKGWKITNVTGTYEKKNGKQVNIPKKELKKVKKGKKFKFPKKYARMYVSVRLEKGDDSVEYLVDIMRD